MAAVKFFHLECVKQEDWNGKDDIYLTINGHRVYSARMGEDDKVAINRTFHVEGDVATVRLYESDDIGNDDLLGEQIPLSGVGEMKFTEDDAYYTLSYEFFPR
ncbi:MULTISPECIES: hypothetical protein [Streptomyces]|uniref:Uncharacterized protein n=1 Tax=Streptomyces siderophoricus TaxID=2802281 RepID=A0ABS1MJQ1_9ACTN|nr:hypothetical protein [Streptomyces sp. 9-7]MBL1087955.1 hypothetical protein [Streptomyces sp. 9-7]